MFRIEDRDIMFNLYEYLNAEELLSLPAYEDLDKETFDILLDSAFKIAKEVLAPINVTGDREGCSLDKDSNVHIPEGFKEAWDEYVEGGWIGLTADPEFGGTGAPQLVGMAANEAFSSANMAFSMYPGLTHANVAMILDEGSDEQKAVYAENMLTGKWGGTMCLTEAGAGSAVGDNKATAVKIREGIYKIVGQKIFISSGDHPLTENNIHAVLARTPDAPAGIKGLSLFLVPKYRVNEDGSLGEFNDVTCVGIEHKMGIKGSATCTLAFGESDNCEGWIVGNEGDGIKIMFHIMNEARLGVGLQSLSIAAAAYNEALDYCRERIQGVDMANFKDPNAPRVPIINHPDVRRMLLTQRAYVHGLRALMYKTAKWGDYALKGEGDAQKKAHAFIELLTPICKAYGSDMAFEVTRLAVQSMGGYGYISEYPVEQYMRDCKICSIYEGTNGIQAMDLVGRKMGMKGGMVFMQFVGEVSEFIAKAKECEATKGYIGELEKSLEDIQAVAMTFMGKNMSGETLYVLQQATPFLRFMGNLVIGWLLAEQAMIADEKLQAIFKDKGAEDDAAKKAVVDDSSEAAFYDAKVKTAKFFMMNLLPENRSLAQGMLSEDTSILDVVL